MVTIYGRIECMCAARVVVALATRLEPPYELMPPISLPRDGVEVRRDGDLTAIRLEGRLLRGLVTRVAIDGSQNLPTCGHTDVRRQGHSMSRCGVTTDISGASQGIDQVGHGPEPG